MSYLTGGFINILGKNSVIFVFLNSCPLPLEGGVHQIPSATLHLNGFIKKLLCLLQCWALSWPLGKQEWERQTWSSQDMARSNAVGHLYLGLSPKGPQSPSFHVLICLFVISMSFLVNYLSNLFPIKKIDCCFLELFSSKSSLLWIEELYQIYNWKIFSSSLWFIFLFSRVSYKSRVLNFD